MIITRTPLRISFVGGGTDLRDYYSMNGGAVISTSIDKYVYVIVKKRYDSKIYLNHSRKEIVDDVEQIEHELIREAMKMTGVIEGIEITTLSDIPAHGSGLGSSSSVTVGVLNALYAYRGISVTAETLASQACAIEIEILKKPIGKQDQYIAAYGGLRRIDFRPDESVTVKALTLDAHTIRRLNSSLLLFYTGIERSADAVLTEQVNNTAQNVQVLDKMKELANRLEHVFIGKKNPDLLGDLLNQNWQLKMTLASPITNSHLDCIYEQALSAGALGGKVLGAGGGGFALFYVPVIAQEAVRASFAETGRTPPISAAELQEFSFSLGSYGSQVIFNI